MYQGSPGSVPAKGFVESCNAGCTSKIIVKFEAKAFICISGGFLAGQTWLSKGSYQCEFPFIA